MASRSSSYPQADLAPGVTNLRVKNISQAVVEAESDIISRATGEQFALKTRWEKVNKALGGGFQMDNIYLLAGASGSGKSFVRNMIETDMCGDLNTNYPEKFIILNFSFEMSAADEVIRSFSSLTGLSYGEIMSSEKPFTQFGSLRSTFLTIANRPVFFVETSGNRMQMLATIHHVHQKFPDHEMVITLDHGLLAEFMDERDEIELLANLAKMFIKVRKNYRCCVILLGQLNDKIENPLRIQNNSLHYPTKTDIHGSKQLYWACDYVIILHRPEELNITSYGRNNFPTTDLLACHVVKARKGIPGLVRLRAQLSKGTIIDWI